MLRIGCYSANSIQPFWQIHGPIAVIATVGQDHVWCLLFSVQIHSRTERSLACYRMSCLFHFQRRRRYLITWRNTAKVLSVTVSMYKDWGGWEWFKLFRCRAQDLPLVTFLYIKKISMWYLPVISHRSHLLKLNDI